MKKQVLTITLLFAIFLSACSPGVAEGMFSMPLPSDGNFIAFNVSIAVEPDGDKHIAWSECLPAGDFSAYCRVIYQRTRSGEIGPRLVFSSPDHGYYMANIVALDDGRAVISFYQTFPGSICRARYAIIPNVVSSLPAINLSIPGDSVNSSCYSKPVLVSNGTTVYTVVDEDHADYIHSYLYRKLQPALAPSAAYVVAADLTRSTDDNAALVAGIDDSNTLHTTWTTRRRESGSSTYTYGLEYANNNGVSGNLSPIDITDSTLWVGNIDMAVQSATKARVVYAEPTVPSTSLWVATIESGVVTQSQISLTPSLEWTLVIPTISNYGGTANQVVVFSAKNNTLSYAQIFYKLLSGGGSPAQITDTNGINRHNYMADVVPLSTTYLAGWRSFHGDCPENAAYSTSGGPPITAFVSTGGCTLYGQTMQTGLASNGDWVAGAWIDKLTSAADAPLVTWISFNTNTIYIPLITR